jgi:hypothetical protein
MHALWHAPQLGCTLLDQDFIVALAHEVIKLSLSEEQSKREGDLPYPVLHVHETAEQGQAAADAVTAVRLYTASLCCAFLQVARTTKQFACSHTVHVAKEARSMSAQSGAAEHRIAGAIIRHHFSGRHTMVLKMSSGLLNDCSRTSFGEYRGLMVTKPTMLSIS